MPLNPDAEKPQLVLPFAEKEYIDMYRTGRILGLTHSAVRYLYLRGLIEIIDFRQGGRKRVRYQSIVDLCDELRKRHCISDRRPPLANSIFRHRDEDLLPFPLSDTMTVAEARDAMGYESLTPIYYLCEEGAFEAYQFDKRSPWRISRGSFLDYLGKRQRLA